MSDHNDKISQQLSAYLDGELSPSESAAVEAAMRAEPQLAEQLEQLRRVRDAVRALPRARASEDFADQVLAKAERLKLVDSASEGVEPPLPWVRYLATAAVVLIAVSVGLIVSVMLWSTSYYDPMRFAAETAPADGNELALVENVVQADAASKPSSKEREAIVASAAERRLGGDAVDSSVVADEIASTEPTPRPAAEAPASGLPADGDALHRPLAVEHVLFVSDMELARKTVSQVLADNSLPADPQKVEHVDGMLQVRYNVQPENQQQVALITKALGGLKEQNEESARGEEQDKAASFRYRQTMSDLKGERYMDRRPAAPAAPSQPADEPVEPMLIVLNYRPIVVGVARGIMPASGPATNASRPILAESAAAAAVLPTTAPAATSAPSARTSD
ncbi:MAG: hypothetical protein GXY38_05510 [Planctomycetes bacterium]|nr:hypothetical protein [Planctomycetota bacterium]